MDAADFMWMQCHTVDGVEFHGYQHRNTRRSLHITAGGTAHRGPQAR